jgi:hypothetical protein
MLIQRPDRVPPSGKACHADHGDHRQRDQKVFSPRGQERRAPPPGANFIADVNAGFCQLPDRSQKRKGCGTFSPLPAPTTAPVPPLRESGSRATEAHRHERRTPLKKSFSTAREFSLASALSGPTPRRSDDAVPGPDTVRRPWPRSGSRTRSARRSARHRRAVARRNLPARLRDRT